MESLFSVTYSYIGVARQPLQRGILFRIRKMKKIPWQAQRMLNAGYDGPFWEGRKQVFQTGLLAAPTRNLEDGPVDVLACCICSAIVYACMAIVISPLFAMAWFATGVAPVPEFVVLVLITSPVWFAFVGLVFGAMAAFVYNLLLIAKNPKPWSSRKGAGTTPNPPPTGHSEVAAD